MSRYSLLLFSIILCGLSSCVSHEQLINFRTGKEKVPTLAQMPKQEITNQFDLKLQANDVLAIIITSPDVILASPYNLVPPQLNGQGITPTSPATFLIDRNGFIQVPSLGEFKAAGLTIREVRENILNKVSTLLVNPSVNIRLINFRISVLGEVNLPGTFPVENERITILEALSRSGDLTPYSNRQHIMVIREKNGIREQGEIDLKGTTFFTSPYYYLQQNDIVYVEPTKAKIAQIQQPITTYLQPIQVGISAILSILTIYALFRK